MDDDRRLDHLSGYRELVHHAVPYGEGPGLSATRDHVAAIDGEAERLAVAELDALLIEELLHLDWVDDYMLRDDPAQHLRRTGGYSPLDLRIGPGSACTQT